MPGLLEYLGGLFGGQPQAPNLGFLPGGATLSPAPSTPGILDVPGMRQQALYGALGQLGAGLLAAGQRRPVSQPSPLPQALAGFAPAYNDALRGQAQSAQLEQQAQRQSAYQGLLAGLPESQRGIFGALPPEQGALAIAQSQLRQGRQGTEAEHAQAGLPMGTLWFNNEGRPFVLQTPGLAGMTTQAQEAARAPYNPVVEPPGARLLDRSSFGPQPSIPGVPSGVPAQSPSLSVPGRAPSTNPMGVIAPGASGNGQTAFRNFATPEEGIAAGQQTIRSIANRIQQTTGQPPTLRQLIGGVPDGRGGVVPMTAYAPAGHGNNNPDVYLRQWPGINPDAPLDVNNPQVMQALTAGIIRQEGIASPGAASGAAPPPVNPIGMPTVAGNPLSMTLRPGQDAPTPIQLAQAGGPTGFTPEAQAYFARGRQPPAAPSGGMPGSQQPTGPRVLSVSPTAAPGTQQGRFEAQSGENMAQYLNQRVVQPAEAAVGALQTAARMRAILGTGDIAAGPGSAVRDYIAEVARTYGGQTGAALADRIQGADYAALRALSSRSVIDALGGSLGTGISSTDRDFIAATVPNPFQSNETMQRFISLLEDRALGQIDRSLGVYARSAPNFNPQTDPFVNNLHSGLTDLGINPGDLRGERQRRQQAETERRTPPPAPVGPAATANGQPVQMAPGRPNAPAPAGAVPIPPPGAATPARPDVTPERIRMAPVTEIQDLVNRWDDLTPQQQLAVRQRLGVLRQGGN